MSSLVESEARLINSHPGQVGGMTVADVMHHGVSCVGTYESVATAAHRMCELGVGALPVCDENDHLCGMITDRDIVVKCVAARRNPARTVVGALAQGAPYWVDIDASAEDVITLMAEHRIRRLPVVDANGRVVGIVTEADISRRLPTTAFTSPSAIS